MTNFSLYEAASWEARTLGLILHDLGTVETAIPRYERSAQFSTRVHGMHRWCRVTEQLVVARALQDAEVWAGFQRLSRVVPVLRRYRTLTHVAKSLTIFGERDTTLSLPKARLIDLEPSSALSSEWFLLVRAEHHQALIVARDLDGFKTQPLAGRRFHAIASHHPVLVERVAAALSGEVDG